MLKDFLNDVFGRMKSFYQNDRAANEHWQQHTDRQHETVEHGQEHDKTVFADGKEFVLAALNIGQEVGVRKHGAFGMSGGSRSIEDDSQRAGRNMANLSLAVLDIAEALDRKRFQA